MRRVVKMVMRIIMMMVVVMMKVLMMAVMIMMVVAIAAVKREFLDFGHEQLKWYVRLSPGKHSPLD